MEISFSYFLKKNKSSLDVLSQGPKSIFKGDGTNTLCAIANAGMLASYDKLQLIVVGKKG
jgi:solute carrier family 25 (adenine nucleotide translocator) protein 4/5/6/31